MLSWLFILLTLVLVWLWWDGLGAKEVARENCKRVCRERDVLFLDDTVALARLRLRRGSDGNLRVYRRFHFEFTSDGEQRYQGYVDMLGNRVLHTEMEAYRIH
ncbi:MAG: DUF3301 domain-containing protein [Gammaproteobacteria bacterium]|nr:DUF3301 domain-containing protein [Gammaproteobacteria bacterium]